MLTMYKRLGKVITLEVYHSDGFFNVPDSSTFCVMKHLLNEQTYKSFSNEIIYGNEQVYEWIRWEKNQNN